MPMRSLVFLFLIDIVLVKGGRGFEIFEKRLGGEGQIGKKVGAIGQVSGGGTNERERGAEEEGIKDGFNEGGTVLEGFWGCGAKERERGTEEEGREDGFNEGCTVMGDVGRVERQVGER